MFTYSILNFDVENQRPVYNDELAFIKAVNELAALKKWYQHINGTIGQSSKYRTTFIYEAAAEARYNISKN